MTGGNLKVTALQLLVELRAHGVTVRPENGGLELAAKQAPPAELLEALKAHKATLLSLLEPNRTAEPPESHGDSLQSCPEHWRHIPELPSKHELVATTADGNGTRWRVCLFDCWFIVRFCPNTSAEQVEATSQDGKRYSLPSMDSLYRALWAEAYAPHLTFRETN